MSSETDLVKAIIDLVAEKGYEAVGIQSHIGAHMPKNDSPLRTVRLDLVLNPKEA